MSNNAMKKERNIINEIQEDCYEINQYADKAIAELEGAIKYLFEITEWNNYHNMTLFDNMYTSKEELKKIIYHCVRARNYPSK